MSAAPQTFRITCNATLHDARVASRSVRAFLASQGLAENELFACELAVVEACNNAVHHATPDQRQQPLTIEASCHSQHVELRVEDHTAGFDLADRIEPPEPEIEHGRGLFLIESMVDQMSYVRGTGRNVLHLRKNRRAADHAVGG